MVDEGLCVCVRARVFVCGEVTTQVESKKQTKDMRVEVRKSRRNSSNVKKEKKKCSDSLIYVRTFFFESKPISLCVLWW